jgi:hypothetical protein
MWQDYFLRARILAVDRSLDKMPRDGLSSRVSPVECDQADIPAFMSAVNGFLEGTLSRDPEARAANISTFDIVLDDGGHKMHEQQYRLAYLFPLVSEGGYFVIEDIHSSKMMPPDENYAAYYNPEGRTSTLQLVMGLVEKDAVPPNTYLTPEQIVYLQDNIESVWLFHRSGNKLAPAPESAVVVIKKKRRGGGR